MSSPQVYYICSHSGCDHVVPASAGKKLMLRHEARFREHKEHYESCKSSCLRCIDLVQTGEWTDAGGRDDFVCRHIGCGYYSSSPRPANRNQAVKRHETAFPIHYNHFEKCKGSCDLCRHLLDDGVWDPNAGKAWVSKGNNQVIARLTTKEQQNTELPSLASLQNRDDVILRTVKAEPKKAKKKKKKTKLMSHSAGSKPSSSTSSSSPHSHSHSPPATAPKPKKKTKNVQIVRLLLLLLRPR